MSSELYIAESSERVPYESGETIEFHSEEMRDNIRIILESRGGVAHIPDENGDEEELAADGGIDLEELSTHDLVMEALEELDDQDAFDGIPKGDIIEWVITRSDAVSHDVHDAVDWLHKHGEIYAPKEGCYKRTLPNEGGSR